MTVDFLYKYARLNQYSEASFTTATIWLSPPSQLNDPFECRPWLTFDATQEQIVASLARTLLRRYSNLTPEEVHARALQMFLTKKPTLDWEQTRGGMIKKFSERIGLYCMSQVSNSILMWSHYAQDHLGYCLQFEATDFTPVFGGAQQVRYAEDLPSVDIFTTPTEDQVDRIFTTKFVGWSYEQEWRLIDHERGPGRRDYPAELLKGVIFGLRMPQEDRVQIRNWLEKRGHPVKLYEAIQDQRRFAIEVREVDA
jgi:hypothetical protein